ncbi:hypothetical protein Esti_003294 [Eimeria stiedai]
MEHPLTSGHPPEQHGRTIDYHQQQQQQQQRRKLFREAFRQRRPLNILSASAFAATAEATTAAAAAALTAAATATAATAAKTMQLPSGELQQEERAAKALEVTPALLLELNSLRILQLRRQQQERELEQQVQWLPGKRGDEVMLQQLLQCRRSLLQLQTDTAAEYAADDVIASRMGVRCSIIRSSKPLWPLLFSQQRTQTWDQFCEDLESLRVEHQKMQHCLFTPLSEEPASGFADFLTELEMICFYSSKCSSSSLSSEVKEQEQLEQQEELQHLLLQQERQQQLLTRHQPRGKKGKGKRQQRQQEHCGGFRQQQEEDLQQQQQQKRQRQRPTEVGTRLDLHELWQLQQVARLWSLFRLLRFDARWLEAGSSVGLAGNAWLHALAAAARRETESAAAAAINDMPWMLLQLSFLKTHQLYHLLQQKPQHFYGPSDRRLFLKTFRCRSALLLLQRVTAAAAAASLFAAAAGLGLPIKRVDAKPFIFFEAAKVDFLMLYENLVGLRELFEEIQERRMELHQELLQSRNLRRSQLPEFGPGQRQLMHLVSAGVLLALVPFLADLESCLYFSAMDRKQVLQWKRQRMQQHLERGYTEAEVLEGEQLEQDDVQQHKDLLLLLQHEGMKVRHCIKVALGDEAEETAATAATAATSLAASTEVELWQQPRPRPRPTFIQKCMRTAAQHVDRIIDFMQQFAHDQQ